MQGISGALGGKVRSEWAIRQLVALITGTLAVSYTHLDVYKRQDDVGEQSRAGSKNQLAAGGCATGNRVRGNKEGTEHAATGEQVEKRIGKVRRVVKPERTGDQRHGVNEGKWNVPGLSLIHI